MSQTETRPLDQLRSSSHEREYFATMAANGKVADGKVANGKVADGKASNGRGRQRKGLQWKCLCGELQGSMGRVRCLQRSRAATPKRGRPCDALQWSTWGSSSQYQSRRPAGLVWWPPRDGQWTILTWKGVGSQRTMSWVAGWWFQDVHFFFQNSMATGMMMMMLVIHPWGSVDVSISTLPPR